MIESTNDTLPSPLTDELETAYAAVLPELTALDSSEVLPVNLDIIAAVSTALGVLPELRNFRDHVATLPGFDVHAFDQLRNYALAASFAHTQHLIVGEPSDDLQGLQEEAQRLREVLHADATALARRGAFGTDTLAELPGTRGYKNIATDLQMLAQLFKQHWPEIRGKCATTELEIQRALQLALRILEIVGLREQGPAGVARTADLRSRAFTLFVRTYDEARRALQYLRWREADVDDVIPSLYAKRGVTRAKPEPVEPEEEETSLGLGVTPGSVVPASPSKPTTPGSSGTSNGGPFVS